MSYEELVENNIKLIYVVIKKLKLTNKLEEYFDVGMIGLVNGAKTYKKDIGIKPSTYLSICIKTQILKEIKRQNANKRVSKNGVIPLDKIIDSEGHSIIDMIPSEIDIEQEIINKEMIDYIYKAISKLNSKERIVLTKTYGLDQCKPLTQGQIAKILNMKQTQISRIKKRSIKKLKKFLMNENYL